MFYSQFILAKKGPLGTIWIAAHLERKLRKNQVADTDIGDSVDSILFPDVPIALRLSSHLLLGVVRIYSRKVGYLFDDCSDALLKIKQAFRSTAVDLPPEESTAPYHSITLPETFDLDDFELPDNDIFQGNYVDHHVSTKEQITLQDSMGATVYSTSQFGLDERFGDGDTSQVGLDLEEDLLLDKVDVSRYVDVSGSVPQTPMEPMDCIDTVADHDEVAEATQAMANEYLPISPELNECAQAPSTPLLIGEPNSTAVQDGLARDYNLELENHDSIEVKGAEGTHSTSSKENGQYMETNQEKSAHLESAATEESVPANGTVDRLDGIEKMKEKVNGGSESNAATTIVMNEEYEIPVEARVHQTDADVAAPWNSQAGEPGVCQTDNIVVCSDLPSEDVSCLSTFSTEEGLHAIGASSEVQGGDYRVEDHTQSDENNKLRASDNEELQVDDRKLGEHLDKATSAANQIENFNTHEELPEPEKLRSLPEGHFDKAEELLVESRPEEEVAEQVDGSQASNRVSGNKRALPETSVTTSLNSVESFGTTKSKRTVDLVPDDDDLLSSILVGRRSSVLKVKPTPPAHDVVSRKRARPASRPSAMKRKVPMDDSMVLHGDTIRQQLINTEDIRRVRKKAPCTRIEVLMIQREFLEEEVFSEPVLTGVSAELACLHNSALNFSSVTISENTDISALMETSKDKECVSTPITSQNTTEVMYGNDVEQFEHASVRTKDNQTDNQNLASSDTGKLESINSNGREADHETMDCECLAGTTEMEIDGKMELAEAANPTIALAVDSSQAEQLCDDIAYVPADTVIQSVHSNQHTGSDALVTQSDHISVQPKEVVVATDTGNIGKGIEVEVLNKQTETIGEVECEFRAEVGVLLEGSKVGVRGDLETNDCGEKSGDVDQTSLNGDQAQEYTADDKLGFYSDNEGLAQQSVHNDKELHLGDEEMRLDASHLVGLNDGEEYASLAEGQYLMYQDENQKSNTDGILASFDHFFEGIEDHAFANDTEFLNFDDESAGEEDDNGLPSGENTQLLVNSGWSARTRAVGKYLQTLFDDEVGHGRKFVRLDNLLAGKTRKEASRMFFETLVLKTKDYIQVEQAQPFDNISIMPVPKLMKTEF